MFDIIKLQNEKPENLSIIIVFKNSLHSETLKDFLVEDPALCQKMET